MHLKALRPICWHSSLGPEHQPAQPDWSWGSLILAQNGTFWLMLRRQISSCVQFEQLSDDCWLVSPRLMSVATLLDEDDGVEVDEAALESAARMLGRSLAEPAKSELVGVPAGAGLAMGAATGSTNEGPPTGLPLVRPPAWGAIWRRGGADWKVGANEGSLGLLFSKLVLGGCCCIMGASDMIELRDGCCWCKLLLFESPLLELAHVLAQSETSKSLSWLPKRSLHSLASTRSPVCCERHLRKREWSLIGSHCPFLSRQLDQCDHSLQTTHWLGLLACCSSLLLSLGAVKNDNKMKRVRLDVSWSACWFVSLESLSRRGRRRGGRLQGSQLAD